jgi:hypothetical protein
MWGWIVQNKEWVFSGAGVTAFGVLWWLLTKFWPKRQATMTATQAPSMSIAPVITMNPTINFPIEPRLPEPPKQIIPPTPRIAAPKPRPNLCIEATKLGRISLEGNIWTMFKPNRLKSYRALLADISNVPNDETHTAKAAVRAAIRMDYGGQQRTYSPLPWLDEYANLVYLETGARKTVVLAVGEDSKTGAWTFVLNHKDYGGGRTEMDWTNLCPIPSDLPFDILMIDMNTGAVLAKFVYLWTFDAINNWPMLKTAD